TRAVERDVHIRDLSAMASSLRAGRNSQRRARLRAQASRACARAAGGRRACSLYVAAVARSGGKVLLLVQPRCDSDARRAMNKERLRVVTLNIHKGLSHFNRRMVIHELREGLQTLDPDLVFLQEVQGLNQRFAMRFAS